MHTLRLANPGGAAIHGILARPTRDLVGSPAAVMSLRLSLCLPRMPSGFARRYGVLTPGPSSALFRGQGSHVPEHRTESAAAPPSCDEGAEAGLSGGACELRAQGSPELKGCALAAHIPWYGGFSRAGQSGQGGRILIRLLFGCWPGVDMCVTFPLQYPFGVPQVDLGQPPNGVRVDVRSWWRSHSKLDELLEWAYQQHEVRQCTKPNGSEQHENLWVLTACPCDDAGPGCFGWASLGQGEFRCRPAVPPDQGGQGAQAKLSPPAGD
jgi:hypothetical protein